MSNDTTFDNTLSSVSKVKTNQNLIGSQNKIASSGKNIFDNSHNHTNNDVNDTTSSYLDKNISIGKIMTSPLRQPLHEPLYAMEDKIISTPKKFESNKSTNITTPVIKEFKNREKDNAEETENLTNNPYQGRLYNVRTPDLNRIIKFRKSNASPRQNLLEKFKVQQEGSDFDETLSSQENTSLGTHSKIIDSNEKTIPYVDNTTVPDINDNIETIPITNDKSISSIKSFDKSQFNIDEHISNKFEETSFKSSSKTCSSVETKDDIASTLQHEKKQQNITKYHQLLLDTKSIENTEINRQCLSSLPKNQIIYSVESKQSQSQTNDCKISSIIQNQSNGTIVFDSQTNAFLSSNRIQNRKDLGDTQIIASTLTFSLDNKYNKLLDFQKDLNYINEQDELIHDKSTDQEETQSVYFKNNHNTSIVKTQPIIYSHSSSTKQDESIKDKNQLEIKSIVISENANDISTQSCQDSLDKIDISYSQNKEISNIEISRTSSPEKKQSQSKLMNAIFPSEEEENDIFINNRNTVKLEVSRVPNYGIIRNDLDTINSNHEIIESDLDESEDLSEIDDDSDYIPTDNESSIPYQNIFTKVFKPDRNTNKLITNFQHDRVSQNELTTQNTDIDDSQRIIIKRRSIKRHLETVDLSDGEENDSAEISFYKKSTLMNNSKKKYIRNKDNNNNTPEYPNDYRTADAESLTKKDIRFKNAIWCQYDVDLKYYPGILLNTDETNGTCLVQFVSGKYTGKLKDISYLDIQIGDEVQDENNISYRICGLQCLKPNPNTIRCIRGYDTVVLEKTGHLHNGEHLLKALGDIRITIESWAERSSIEERVCNALESYNSQYQMHITKRHTRAQTISPTKSNRSKKLNYTEPESDEDSDNNDDTDDIKSQVKCTIRRLIELSQNISKSNKKIFDQCVFVLTGISALQDGLSHCIKTGGGTIIKQGFKQLFEFDILEQRNHFSTIHSLKLILKSKVVSNNYKFACILSDRHSRSLKYLETLALGWPTLHWKFIEACITHNEIHPTLIYQYLLPSGVSFRLGSALENEKPPVLSNDIFEFYSNFIQDTTIQKQIEIRQNVLENYTIILCGKLELDNMLKFCFAALGVSRLIHTCNINDLIKKKTAFIDKIIYKDDPDINKVIFFINEKEKEVISSLKKIKRIFHEKYEKPTIEYHIETKEWLIQTLINRTSGFS